MTLGEMLKGLRKKEGIGIKTLAPRLNVDHTYLSKVENNKSTPSEDVLNRIAVYFKQDPEELMALAGRIPDDVQRILRENPREAAAFLRQRFFGAVERPGSREPH